jgi:hypothetical protein
VNRGSTPTPTLPRKRERERNPFAVAGNDRRFYAALAGGSASTE